MWNVSEAKTVKHLVRISVLTIRQTFRLVQTIFTHSVSFWFRRRDCSEKQTQQGKLVVETLSKTVNTSYTRLFIHGTVRTKSNHASETKKKHYVQQSTVFTVCALNLAPKLARSLAKQTQREPETTLKPRVLRCSCKWVPIHRSKR